MPIEVDIEVPTAPPRRRAMVGRSSRSVGVGGDRSPSRRSDIVADVILLVRHGESTWNAEHRWAGQADPPLTDQGRAGARLLAERLAGRSITGVVSSDLRRASETAAIVAARLGLDEPHHDARLRERRCDAWSGRTSAEIEVSHPGLLARWRRGDMRELPHPSEVWVDFSNRVMSALTVLAASEHRRLVVGHAGLFRVVESACGVDHRRMGNLDGLWLHLVAGRLARAMVAVP